MEQLQIFSNPELGEIRAINDNNEIPWFVGKDVTEILGYQNHSKALIDHVDDEDKLNNESLLSIGQRGGWLINESGLYSLIMSSRLPKAKIFKRWVTSEVLPTIRKQGYYSAVLEVNPQDSLSLKDRLSFAQCIAKSPKWAEPLIRSLLEPYLPKLVAEPEPVYKPKKILEYLTSDDDDYYANDPKNLEIKARLGENTARSLDKCARELRVSKSAIVRLGIRRLEVEIFEMD